jgi:hypothetical protein
MDWPVPFPAEMSAGTVSVRSYDTDDAAELLEALKDERAWEHIPRAIPADAAELDESIQSWRPGGNRLTFTVRQGSFVVGMTSVIFDPQDPAGVEVGGTQFDPAVWERASTRRSSACYSTRSSTTAPNGSSCVPTNGTAGRPPRSASSARPTSASSLTTASAGTAPAGGA